MKNENINIVEDKNKENQAFSHMERKSFYLIVALLSTIILITWLATFFVPQGSFLRDDEGMIIGGTYTQGAVQGIAFWKVITAPVRVLFSEDALTIIMISVFLLVMSGVFNLLEKTGGIRVIIGKMVQKFSDKKRLVVCLTVLAFMAFGSCFGMFEELVTLLPLIIVFVLSLGMDTLTGLGVCLMSSCFGFSAAITNPFSVGIVADLAGVSVLDGIWLRVLFFFFVYAAVCLFLLWHIKKIAKSPEKSLTYEIDKKKRESLNLEIFQGTPKENKIVKTYIIFFAIQFVVFILIASIRAISGYAIPILAASFLIGGIVCGFFVCEKKKDIFVHIGKGAVAMLPAVLMIMLASSVKLIMSESGILDTIMNFAISALDGGNKFVCVIFIYFLILFLQVFIGSSSAKIMLIMPIILPVATSLGISTSVVILTYCIADGFTDVIIPTNPVLLIGLSMANVSYGKWVKWTWKFQICMFLATILLLIMAVGIGY